MRSVLVFALCCGITVPCAAQETLFARPVRVVISGGMQVPTGDFADAHKLGAHAEVGVLIRAFGVQLRPELSYVRFPGQLLRALTAMPTTGNTATTDPLSTLLGGFANIELPLGSGRMQPYLLGGLGAVNLTSDVGSIEQVSDVKASINVGVGMRFRMGGISGFVEARLNNVPAGDAQAIFKDLRSIPVSFGFVF